MKVGQLISELVKYDESLDVLIFPESIDIDDSGNEILLAGGVGVLIKDNGVDYLGDVEFIQEVYEGEVGFDLDDLDDDELDIDIEFDEERLN